MNHFPKTMRVATAAVAGAVLASVFGAVAYAAPTIFPYNSGAHILPFESAETPNVPGEVTINNGNILLPTDFFISGGAANNRDVRAYNCATGEVRDLIVTYTLPANTETISMPHADVYPCTGFELDGDDTRAKIVMSRGAVQRIEAEQQPDGHTFIFRGIDPASYTEVSDAVFKVTKATESFEIDASAKFENGLVYTTRVGEGAAIGLKSLEMNPQYVAVENPFIPEDATEGEDTGTTDGDGTTDGEDNGTVDGDGTTDGEDNGTVDGDGTTDGEDNGTVDGDGTTDGEGDSTAGSAEDEEQNGTSGSNETTNNSNSDNSGTYQQDMPQDPKKVLASTGVFSMWMISLLALGTGAFGVIATKASRRDA